MFGSKSLFTPVMAAGFIAVLALSSFADTIRLKDGSIIKGRITGFSGGRFVVVVGDGRRRRELNFDAAEVESVTFDSQAVSRSTTRPTDTANQAKTAPQIVISDKTAANPEPVNRQPETVAAKDPEPEPAVPIRQTSSAKPVEVSVKVLADNTANGWTNSGWVVRKGQKIRITGSGQISIGGGKTCEAGGLYDVEDEAKLLKAVPTGALIAVIGDDNNDFIYIGTSREFVATRDGALFLGVNEGNLNDNSGSFNVKVEIAPDGV